MSTAVTNTQSADVTGKSPLSNWIRRHPLPAYFVLAFAGAWLFITPILLSQKGLGLIALPDPALLILLLLATFMGPTPAAFIVTGIIEGKAGVHRLLRRMVQWKVGLRWYLLVLVGYPVVFLIGATIALGTTPLTALTQQWPLLFTTYLPLILFGLFYPALGEEPGWRGFALPRLQKMYGPLVGTLILGTLHALWHFPVYFIPGAISDGGFDLTVFIANSLAIVVSTFVWTWLFNNANASILFAMFVHATSNANSGFIPKLLPADVSDPFFTFKLMAVIALLVIVFTKGRLSYTPNATVEQADVRHEAIAPATSA